MGRHAKIKAARREAKRERERTHGLPPCSYRKCPNGRPPGTNLVRKTGTGEFLTACEDCIDPMMEGLRAAGIDAQVFTKAALEQLSAGARARALAGTQNPTAEPMAVVAHPMTNAPDGMVRVNLDAP